MFSSWAWRPRTSLQLGGGYELADDVLDVVADDALGGRKVANAHPDDPALDLGHGFLVAPLLDVLTHRDILGSQWLAFILR